MQPPIPIWAFESNPSGFSLRGCSWIAAICRPSMTGRDYWEMFSSSLSIPMGVLKPLYDMLPGDPSPASHSIMTPAAKEALYALLNALE